jgi:hypothetical protein
MSRPNMLNLEKVIEKIISELQEKGLISNTIDHKVLLENTMDHLKKTLGEDLPKGELLKDPMILMKLTLSIMAVHKNPANPAIKQIFQIGTPEQPLENIPQQINQLIKDLQLDPKILKFMQLCLNQKKEELSEVPDDDPDKNKCVAIVDATGKVLDVLEGVFATSSLPGAKLETKEELLSATGIAETLLDDIKAAVGSLETSYVPSPYGS